jgi:hypothetical protein
MEAVRAFALRCLTVVLLAATLFAPGLTTTVDAVAAGAMAASDAGEPGEAPSDRTGFSAPPPAQIPDRSIGPGAAVVVSPTTDAHSPSRFPGFRTAPFFGVTPPTASLLDVHPTPQGHATPLLI